MMVLVAYIFSIPNGLWDYFMKFRVYIFQALSSYTNQTFQMTIYINEDIIILWCCIIQTKLFLYSTNQIMAVTLIICLHNAAIPYDRVKIFLIPLYFICGDEFYLPAWKMVKTSCYISLSRYMSMLFICI